MSVSNRTGSVRAEPRRIDPPLNLGKTLMIFVKNWLCRSSPRLKKISDPPLDKIRSALTGQDKRKCARFNKPNVITSSSVAIQVDTLCRPF